MTRPKLPPKALVILGPTAVGKSRLAMELAAKFQTGIISADSVQVYKYLDVGSAKPDQAIREEIPHYLIDIVEPDVDFDTGSYLTHCQNVIPKIQNANKLPLIVGGTGLYLKAIVDGLVDIPGKDEDIRQKLYQQYEAKGEMALYQRLVQADPAYAAVIHPHDVRRIVRALEVFELTGKPLSVLHQTTTSSFPEIEFVQVGLLREKSDLHERINMRTELMFEHGLVAEVEFLLNEKGYSPKLNSLQSLGYKQVIQYLQGEFNLDETKQEIKKQTRNFAKRQMTWFNKNKRIEWFNLSLSASMQTVIDFVKKELCD